MVLRGIEWLSHREAAFGQIVLEYVDRYKVSQGVGLFTKRTSAAIERWIWIIVSNGLCYMKQPM